MGWPMPWHHGVANAVALGITSQHATIVLCDNVSSSYMSSNPVHHQRTKHIEIDLHLVREKVSIDEVKVLHVPSSRQFADISQKDYRRPCLMNLVAA
jgi:hypothetical protein